MNTTEKRELANTVREAQAYLDRLAAEPGLQPDYAQLHRYLTALSPHLYDAKVSGNLIRTTAHLYFALQRYQDAAVTSQRVQDPGLDGLRRSCDFSSGYCTGSRDWRSRQDEIWDTVRAALPQLTPDNTVELLRDPLAHCFPTHLVTVGGEAGERGFLLLGNPDKIYSLFPMLYLLKHKPEDLTADWDILLDDPEVTLESAKVLDKPLYSADIQVRVSNSTLFHVGPMVDLELWHPLLQDAVQAARSEGEFLADYLLSRNLPAAAAALYVGRVSVAEAPFAREEAVPLDRLGLWFQQNGMAPDIPLEQLFRHRVYAFTREPVDSPRPRADILRGETCMPELEQIYFLRSTAGLAALQAYGVGYWFLIVPKHVCGGDFPFFREELIVALRLDEHDAVCFTGWAEGTRNYYIDFLSLSSAAALNVLQQYLEDIPGGGEVRIATFYWNSVPRTADVPQETAAQDFHAKEPPREQVSEEERAALERAFRETRWEKRDGAPSWDIDNASSYDISTGELEDAMSYILACDNANTPYDFSKIHEKLQRALPTDDAPDAGSLFCESLATVLHTMERFHEAAKWLARVKESAQQREHLYRCRFGSMYPDGLFQWEARRQTFWRLFAVAASDLAQAIPEGADQAAVLTFQRQTDALFPSQELLLCRGGGGKDVLQTGLPGGFLTLPAMLYLTSHYPASLGKRWDITVSAGDPSLLAAGDGRGPLSAYQVSLWDRAGTVSLSLWHPQLAEVARSDPQGAKNAAVQLVNRALPLGARLLYVEDISAAAEEPEDAFPLAELPRQMRDRGYLPDVSLDTLLARRKYAIARAPKDTGRPRDDILRGETCMPELDFLYNHLWEEGQIILERHGLSALFLMIPNALCGGDPARYRQQLQRYLTQAEGDKVFFTGWAEGTQYCYLDLISMHGRALLQTMNEYALSNPGGRDLRFSTFYWNSKPLPWVRVDALRQILPDSPEHYAAYAKDHLEPDRPAPDIMAEAELEMSFQRTFVPEDFCAPRPADVPAPAAAPQAPAGGKKKLSKAQRRAQSGQANNKNGNNKNGKKKR